MRPIEQHSHRKAILLIAVVYLLFSVNAPRAAERDDPAPHPKVCTNPSGLALRGFDPVAYFENHRPRRGHPEITTKWRGAQWRFATADHLRLFIENPEKFTPQYGGFCAYTMADGVFVDGNPLYWQIVNGRLFINCGAGVHRAWQSQKLEHIRAADKAWKKIGAGNPLP